MERLKVAMTPPCLRSPGRTFLFTEIFLFSSCFAKIFYLLLLWATVDHSAFFFVVLASRMQVYYPWHKKNLKLFIPLPNWRGLGGLITFHCISSKAPEKDEKKICACFCKASFSPNMKHTKKYDRMLSDAWEKLHNKN